MVHRPPVEGAGDEDAAGYGDAPPMDTDSPVGKNRKGLSYEVFFFFFAVLGS